MFLSLNIKGVCGCGAAMEQAVIGELPCWCFFAVIKVLSVLILAVVLVVLVVILVSGANGVVDGGSLCLLGW